MGQGLYFLRLAVFRRPPSWAMAGVCCGGLTDLAYGMIQSEKRNESEGQKS
jgi:hypothetical protein